MNKNQLFSEFEAVTTTQWHTAIEKFLKGESAESLNWIVEEDLVASPLHRTEDTVGELLHHQKTNNDWRIEELIVVREVAEANKMALEALQKGANALQFVLTEMLSVEAIDLLLKDILLDLVAIHFDTEAIDAQKFYESLTFIKNKQKLILSFACAELDLNWVATIAIAHPFASLKVILIEVNDGVVESVTHALNLISQCIDFLLDKGIDKEIIVSLFRLEFVVGEEYFVEIARIRAFKRVWLGLLEAYNYDKAIYPYLTAKTTLSESKDDQYWNMISTTTQAMSAAIAGIDSMTIVPSNGLEESDTFSRRIARNVHHLLIAESFMNRVVDPAAGSYYVENLTQDISAQAWQKFCPVAK